jgi:Pin2-interacting protein X1
MGLAETRRKKKLIPSNAGPSAWSTAAPTSSVGFKLMSSMGWAPGKGLGNNLQGEKENIKYALKDDLLGIGAKKEYGGGVWRGMGEVDDLYRRLDVGGTKSQDGEEVNGDVVELEQQIKIRGGWQMKFCAGDTYTSAFSRDASEVEGTNSAPGSSDEGAVQEKTKKRKRGQEKEKKRKRTEMAGTKVRKAKKAIAEADGALPRESTKQESSIDKFKTGAERDDQVDKVKNDKNDATVPESVGPTNGFPKKKKSKKAKDEKRKDKEESRKKKEKKEKKKDKLKAKYPKLADTVSETTTSNSASVSSVVSLPNGTIQIPADTTRSSSIPRHMHRARFLAMKRASVMDQNALREILGVKG